MVRTHVSFIAMIAVVVPAAFSPGAQDQPKQTKVEILRPTAGQTLSGEVDVRLRIIPAQPGRFPSLVYAGLGGPPWVKLARAGDTNEWSGNLDCTMVPNGGHNLIVKTTDKRAGATIAVRARNPLKCYFADLHSHTGYSDGVLLPAVAHDYAREVAKLDVFSLTDHLEQVDDSEWLDTREQAWDANDDGQFVAIPGLEWTKGWGHVNIFDPQTRHWPPGPTEFYRAIAAAGVVAKFNHPGDGTKSHGGLAYSEIGDQAIQMMEVRRPDEELAFLRALKLGWHIAPDGSDDTHGPNWGNVRSWTGILAPGLSKRNVLAALKGRHCFSTLDRNCRLRLWVNGADMGSILTEPVNAVEVSVRVADTDPADAITRIELFEDGKVVQTDEPNKQGRCWTTSLSPDPGRRYYFVKVTQKDGDSLWSAPVWLTVRAARTNPAGAQDQWPTVEAGHVPASRSVLGSCAR